MLLQMAGFPSFFMAQSLFIVSVHVCVHHIFLIHSPGNGHRLFPCLGIVNNAAMNTGLHISFQIVVLFPLDKHSEVELLNHDIVLFLVF